MQTTVYCNYLIMPNKKIATFAYIVIFSAVSAIMPENIPAQHPPQKSSLKIIVIDAGHGGKDGGAPGAYSNEKVIALAIALKLQAQLKTEMPEVKVVMTRTTDVYPTLYQRANLANAAKGDLFISIHCNSTDAVVRSEFTGYKLETYYKGNSPKKYTRKIPQYRSVKTSSTARGTETYLWAANKNEDKMLAMRENAALFQDKSISKDIAGFDPNSPEKMILYSLKTQQYFARSANLALDVEHEFKKAGRISRQVRQRQVGIWVLQATAMPSILIETGYISNPSEEDYLNSKTGQNQITGAIVKALKRYKIGLDNHSTSVADNIK